MNRREILKSGTLFFGYAVSTAALSELFVSCSADKKLDWQPTFLDNHQANVISEMTERILPKTKTPGAKELGVDKFIDKMLKDLLSPAEQKDFVKGLEVFEETFEKENNKKFLEATPQQQEDFLRKMDKEAAKLPATIWGIALTKPTPVPFFRRVKELTLLGYFTSEKIGKNVLSFDPTPGGFIACMPLSQVGNAWNE